MKMSGYKYNGAVNRVEIEEGRRYEIAGGIIFTHDLFKPIPDEFRKADYIVIDPPWEQGNLSTFYTKAEKLEKPQFTPFLDRVFEIIRELDVDSCYMEFGKRNLEMAVERMKEIFPNVTVKETCYYNKYPCFMICGEDNPITLEEGIKDELLLIDEIIGKKEGTVLDFCFGRGCVGRSAISHGRKFIGTELNINRLAVFKEWAEKNGGKKECLSL